MTSTARSNRSAAAISGTNLTLEPVDKFVDRGLLRKVMQTFGCKAALVSSTDKKHVLQRMFGNPGAQERDTLVTYPYALLTPTSYAEDTTGRFNGHVLARSGFTAVFADGIGVQNGGGDPGMKRAFNVHLMAVEYTVDMEFVTNSAAALRTFVAEWMFAKRKQWLSFVVNYGNVDLAVRVEPSGSVSLPLREADAGQVPTYTATTSMTVHGYISQATLVEQQIVSNLDVAGILDDGVGTGFFSFGSRAARGAENPDGVENGLVSTRSR